PLARPKRRRPDRHRLGLLAGMLHGLRSLPARSRHLFEHVGSASVPGALLADYAAYRTKRPPAAKPTGSERASRPASTALSMAAGASVVPARICPRNAFLSTIQPAIAHPNAASHLRTGRLTVTQPFARAVKPKEKSMKRIVAVLLVLIILLVVATIAS